MKVGLVTTGDLEFRGLPTALRALFPQHEFVAVDAGSGRPFHGFTSNRVRPLLPADPPGRAAQLIRAALGEVVPSGAPNPPCDLAVILDDLELANVGNETVVVDHLRTSAQRVLSALRAPAAPHAVAATLRERVSFHLAVPMVESWFFGDAVGLASEVPAAHMPPVLGSAPDHEAFLSTDAGYLADNGAHCQKHGHPDWCAPWVKPARQAHPKRYLQWLLRDSNSADCTRYKEPWEGVRLLTRLDWATVLGHPNGYPYLRALIRDLESTLGPSAVPQGGATSPLTMAGPSATTFRNL